MLVHRIPTQYYLAAAVFGAILVVHTFALMRFPAPSGDEAWMAGRAWELVHSGSSFGPLDGGVLDRFEGYRYFYPWLSSAIQSMGPRLFGEPSLFAIRFSSLIIGMLLLVAIFGIGMALDGHKLGLFAVAFTACSWPFFLSAHLGRPDIITAAFGYSAIALHLHNRKNRIWQSALAGLVALLAFEVHAHGAVFAPALLALFFWKYGRQILRQPDFWGFIAGAALGLAVFLGLHILPAPQTYLKLTQIVFTATHIPPLLTLNLRVIWSAVRDMAILVFYVYPQAVLAIWAAVRLVGKRIPYAGTLLVLTGAIIIAYTLLVRNKFLLYYAILFSPALSLLLAAFFHDFLQKQTRTKAEPYLRQAITLVVCIFTLPLILRFNSLLSYRDVQARVNAAVRPGEVIMANQLYWFGLRDHKYYSWENLAFFRRYMPGSDLEDALDSLEPDLLIVDGQLENFIFDGEHENSYLQGFNIPKSELESFLRQQAVLINTVEVAGEVPVRIYRINWAKPDP